MIVKSKDLKYTYVEYEERSPRGTSMTRIYSALVGSYPRPAGLARLINRFNSGKVSREDLEEGYRSYTKRLFKFLTSVGLEYITDGMLRWDDIFNPLMSYVDGVKVNGLYRFYENNFFFRAPQVVGKVKLKSECPIAEWFKTSLNILNEVLRESDMRSNVVLKPTLPGPLTLATNSINESYSNLSDLIHDYTYEVLMPLIKELKDAGAQVIEVHEPELVFNRVSDDVKYYATKLLNDVSHKLNVRLWVQTYFGSAYGILCCMDYLLTSIIGIDLVSSKDDYVNYIHNFVYKEALAVGIYDSRNTVMERSNIVKWHVNRLINLHVRELFLCNNAPMDFIPENIAIKKLRRLGRFTRQLKSKVGVK